VPTQERWEINMTVQTTKPGAFERLLTAKDAATFLRVSLSWLAKARMRGDGPPFIKIGRSIRYSESALLQWTKAHQRLSTSEQ
jgi:predicted DNA-binding transcriptional regulator AlpA